ncbi:MAG: ABC transporter ATP-binding protein [Candidatus Bathyarchaeota archaeon]|nr:MAG: ABC transporter ATP-binding protein [Candidatus Bathyarchaeota archaeon]
MREGSLLTVKNIHFRYPGNVQVLNGASFSAERGEVVAIIGSNGSGKTTLLLIAAGLLDPQNGLVLLGEKPLREQLPEARKKIGLVFQDPNDQLFNPTVYDEIAFTLRQLLSSEEEVERKVRQVAQKLKLGNLLARPPFKLSMGEKRRVTLASVLAYDPDILLLDEPTANLSVKYVEETEQVIMNAKNAGKAVVIASHDVEFVANVSDRVYIINEGSMQGGSNAKSILTDESMLKFADMRPPLVLQTLKVLRLESHDNPLTIKDLTEASNGNTHRKQRSSQTQRSKRR